jgi:hypothetical protein
LIRSIRLCEVEPGRQRDRVLGLYAAALRPVLALHVADEIADPDVADAGAGCAHPADAFRPGRRRQRRCQPVIAAAERQIGGIDREGEDVEHELAGRRGADIRHLDACRDGFRLTVCGDLDPLHATPPSSRRRCGAGA